MCGRYSLGKNDRLDWSRFGVSPFAGLAAHRNIAPGSDVVAVRETPAGRAATFLRWGLVPAWAKDPSVGHRLANARAESAHEKPAFRAAFRARRCLLPADGFYEWQVVPGQRTRQPWRIEPADGGIIALGGLWEEWRDPAGTLLTTCTILTVRVNVALAHIHDRLPVIVAARNFGAWLSTQTPVAGIQALCHPAPDELLSSWRISPRVIAPSNDDPSVAARAGD